MFNKKRIIIGETYLFDVLNETNLANLTSLVTVVKKTKHNKYAVVSVNNGCVFETKAKYLTPYIDQKKASVIRCHYGTTEFDNQDIGYFKTVDSMIDMIVTTLKNVSNEQDIDKILECFDDMRKWGDDIKEKIQQYVNISNYKEYIKILNTGKNINNNNTEDFSVVKKDESNNSTENSTNRGDFKYYFDKTVESYANECLSLHDFCGVAQDVIIGHFPKNNLINKNIVLSDTEVNYMIKEILTNVHYENNIAFVFGMDDNNNWHVISIYSEEDPESTINVLNSEMANDLKEFIYDLYPDIREKGKCVPKYSINIIYVNRRENDYEENE